MHFDDRLDTVLRQPARGREMARVQFVQLLDLLGKSDAETGSARLDPAYSRLSQLAGEIAAKDRADLLRGSGLRLRNPALVAFLSEDEPAVASAAIAAADLSQPQWLDLVPALPVTARGVLRHRRDLGASVEGRLEQLGVRDRGLPPAPVAAQREAGESSNRTEDTVMPAQAPPVAIGRPAAAGQHGESESRIGDLVRRIENFRKSRPAAPPPGTSDAPRLPLGEPDQRPRALLDQFDFATDAAGIIVRTDADSAPMLVGMSLATARCFPVQGSDLAPPAALRSRQPIAGQVVEFAGAPAIAGRWRIDAAPLFDVATGRYTGHAGRARRLAIDAATQSPAAQAADRMRQVLHELRNPAGAVQMASEYIQQAIGGTVSHEYRSIAASIASDTAIVLGGLDELDRLVKLDAGVIAVDPGETDLGATIAATLALLEPTMAQRESGFAFESSGAVAVAMSRNEIDRLIWRLLAAMASAAGPVERLALTLDERAGFARLEIALPDSLCEMDDDELFVARTGERTAALSAGMFGLGFTLRLAAAEARAAGGSLRRDGSALILQLPAVQEPSANVRSG